MAEKLLGINPGVGDLKGHSGISGGLKRNYLHRTRNLSLGKHQGMIVDTKPHISMSRWWQFKYFWNFHPENWGRLYTILIHIF